MSASGEKRVVVLAGPNGAGKTTSSQLVLPDLVAGAEFVNADVIEREISAPGAGSRAFAAGRIMLERIDELATRGENLSFETTLASRTFAPLLRRLAGQDYTVYLLYFWLPSAELAIARVADRVRRGGHHVPDDVIRRRYRRGLSNLFSLYCRIADVWRVYDSSSWPPQLIAHRIKDGEEFVLEPDIWRTIQQGAVEA